MANSPPSCRANRMQKQLAAHRQCLESDSGRTENQTEEISSFSEISRKPLVENFGKIITLLKRTGNVLGMGDNDFFSV
jgi:hypothetical protein